MVLTSHIEGEGGPCQGPLEAAAESAGRKAGNQGLTHPQACGQHQGAHKHSPAAKPGGRQWDSHQFRQESSGEGCLSRRASSAYASHSPGPGGHSPATSPEVVHLLQGHLPAILTHKVPL